MAVSRGTNAVNTRDGSGNALTSQAIGSARPLDVNIAGSAGTFTAASATIGSALNSAVTATVSQAGNATIVMAGGTYTSVPIIFEATYDGTNWFTIDASMADGTGTITAATFTSAAVRAWNVPCPGYTSVRVRITATATATTMPTITIVPGPMLFDPSPTTMLNPLAALGGPSTQVGQVPAPVYMTNTTTVTGTSLIASPGTGLSIYVTDMEGSNEGATATAIALLEATTVRYRRFMAASGGGFVTNLKTPWKLPAATALNVTVTAATTWDVTVNYYIAP